MMKYKFINYLQLIYDTTATFKHNTCEEFYRQNINMLNDLSVPSPAAAAALVLASLLPATTPFFCFFLLLPAPVESSSLELPERFFFSLLSLIFFLPSRN